MYAHVAHVRVWNMHSRTFKRSHRYVAFSHIENLINLIPYCRYDRLDLYLLTDDECKSEFRFYKKDLYLLAEVLHVPFQIRWNNRDVVGGIEAVCILLKRFAYACRYSDMLSRFARPVPQFCMISNQEMDFIYQTHHHRLKNFNQPWLSQFSLQNYAEVIHATGASLQNCWGFIDVTVRLVSRPGKKPTGFV